MIAEISGRLFNDNAGWSRLQRRLQPAKMGSVVGSGGQAPRAALVCLDIETFTRPGSADAAVTSARKLRRETGSGRGKTGDQSPGIRPVHANGPRAVLPRICRNLSADDARQVLGASLPLSTLVRGTAYGNRKPPG